VKQPLGTRIMRQLFTLLLFAGSVSFGARYAAYIADVPCEPHSPFPAWSYQIIAAVLLLVAVRRVARDVVKDREP
jgi:hypothetical protein